MLSIQIVIHVGLRGKIYLRVLKNGICVMHINQWIGITFNFKSLIKICTIKPDLKCIEFVKELYNKFIQ